MARYLIDSHIFFWAIDAPERLLTTERTLLESPDSDVAVSTASLWELSIKLAKGSLQLRPRRGPLESDYLARQAAIAGFTVVPIESAEAEYVRQMPRIHGDPFDRMLIAQAILSGRVIITRDAVFAHYPGAQIFVL